MPEPIDDEEFKRQVLEHHKWQRSVSRRSALVSILLLVIGLAGWALMAIYKRIQKLKELTSPQPIDPTGSE